LAGGPPFVSYNFLLTATRDESIPLRQVSVE
jgi:hypothetical protein